MIQQQQRRQQQQVLMLALVLVLPLMRGPRQLQLPAAVA
jgi:hypothetical protein